MTDTRTTCECGLGCQHDCPAIRDTRTTEAVAGIYLLAAGLDARGRHAAANILRANLETIIARLTAYEAEHEAAGPVVESIRPWRNHARVEPKAHKFIEAYDNAERMRQSE